MSTMNPLYAKREEQLKKERASLVDISLSIHEQDPISDVDRLQDNAASDTEANEENAHDRMQAMNKTVREKIEAIDATIIRIHDGTYGICVSCHKEIDPKRLDITPTASTCIMCEEKKRRG